MQSFLKHPLRVTGRLLWLTAEIVVAAIDYVIHVSFRSKSGRLAAQTQWLHRACDRTLRIFNANVHCTGPFPSAGLLVCNHLSYLDILVLSAITPCVFVSKFEVKRWPIFGWFAALAGTVFVHRDKRQGLVRTAEEMQRILDRGALLVLFAEGTTTGGSQVLPFKSSLLEPATHHAQPVSAGCIQYALADGDVCEEVCYWKDMSFLAHLLNLLSKRRIEASVRFTQLSQAKSNRKQLAGVLHSEVVRLKEALQPNDAHKLIASCPRTTS